MDDFREHLMRDVLGEDSDPAFREALLGQTLRLARRQRRLRKLAQTMPTVAAMLILLLLSLHLFQPAPSPNRSPDRPYTLVRTQPLLPSALVTTKSLTAANLVTTTHSVAMLRTARGAPSLRELTDEELLKLTGDLPVVLVRQNNHAAELVFVNQKTGKR